MGDEVSTGSVSDDGTNVTEVAALISAALEATRKLTLAQLEVVKAHIVLHTATQAQQTTPLTAEDEVLNQLSDDVVAAKAALEAAQDVYEAEGNAVRDAEQAVRDAGGTMPFFSRVAEQPEAVSLHVVFAVIDDGFPFTIDPSGPRAPRRGMWDRVVRRG